MKKKGSSPEEQMKFEKQRFKKRQEEKPIDFEKIKELVEKGVQKTLCT